MRNLIKKISRRKTINLRSWLKKVQAFKLRKMRAIKKKILKATRANIMIIINKNLLIIMPLEEKEEAVMKFRTIFFKRKFNFCGINKLVKKEKRN